MKISEEGSSFIPQKVQDVYDYFGDYDFKNCWKTAANQIKDHQSFYKAVINQITKSMLENQETLEWFMQYAIASKIVNFDNDL